MKKCLLNRELDNLLFFYELYLNSIDEESYLEWSLLFDMRTKIEEKLRKNRTVNSIYIKNLTSLDRELKEKAKFYSEKILFGRLRKMIFPEPPENYWWYYLDRAEPKSRKIKVEASLHEKSLHYSYA